MKNKLVYFGMVMAILWMTLPAGCSRERESESEKGKIEDVTDHAASAIVERIETPMNKAQKAKAILENRMRDIDEDMKNK